MFLGYRSIPEFHADFKGMIRTAKLHYFVLSDIKELFKAAARTDYALLKGCKSEDPRPRRNQDGLTESTPTPGRRRLEWCF
ncbi:MAG: hypothetical protein JRN06_00360 [Nitrososphaerota archaeon]|nr:hypothetical protein [Nitrososphaerota archaeon]MDG7023695.1 hypothetical protein [Nitrososphaerota archaeon]